MNREECGSTKNIDNLFEEVKDLKKALVLLKDVYRHIGPYRDGELRDREFDVIWDGVRKFFEFNVSE